MLGADVAAATRGVQRAGERVWSRWSSGDWAGRTPREVAPQTYADYDGADGCRRQRPCVKRTVSATTLQPERVVDRDHRGVARRVPGVDGLDLGPLVAQPVEHRELHPQAEPVAAVRGETEVSSWAAIAGRSSWTQTIVIPAGSPVARCRATIVYGVCRCPASHSS